jgi:uncharacterized ion transporter superfamily protein YfcC
VTGGPAYLLAAGAMVFALAAIVFILISDESNENDFDSRFLQTLNVLARLRNLVVYVIICGLAITYLVIGNGNGKIVGLILATGALVGAILFFLRHR